jgi:hypothetical protein
MTMAHGGGAAAAIANAIKASGSIVRVEPQIFAELLRKVERPLIVYAQGGLFSGKHQYLTSYKGLTFFAKSSQQIDLPRGVEVIVAKKIWTPS